MPKLLTVAKVIVVNSEGKVLLLRRSEGDERRPLQWDIPGGHTERDEFSEEAATRETLEEAGISVDPHQLCLVYTITEMVKPSLNVSWLFYIAHTEQPTVKTSREHSEYMWVSLREAIEKIDYNRQKVVLTYVGEHNLLEATRA